MVLKTLQSKLSRPKNLENFQMVYHYDGNFVDEYLGLAQKLDSIGKPELVMSDKYSFDHNNRLILPTTAFGLIDQTLIVNLILEDHRGGSEDQEYFMGLVYDEALVPAAVCDDIVDEVTTFIQQTIPPNGLYDVIEFLDIHEERSCFLESVFFSKVDDATIYVLHAQDE